MPYELSEINVRVKADPAAFVAECEAGYEKKVRLGVNLIRRNLKSSPIVLLTGPSGSGKTTTAKKLEEGLERCGLIAHTVSLDNYFMTLDESTAPRTKNGEIDYESPKILDMDLLNEHFSMLERGEEIKIPHFVFTQQARSDTKFTPMSLGPNDIAIFEGIHALNPAITGEHPEATKLYVSARSNIDDGGKLFFKSTWMRLVRRVVRDHLFRGADAQFTMRLWANVRRGEKTNISPYKEMADHKIDTTFPYELSALRQIAEPLFASVPDNCERADELRELVPDMRRFEIIESSLIPPESMLREFIGGGIYQY